MAGAKGGSSAPRNPGYRRSSSCFPSCFTGSLVLDDDAEDGPAAGAGPSRRRASWFSRFRGKKKTVPVDGSTEAAAPPAGDIELAEMQTKIPVEVSATKSSFFKIFQKDKDKSSRTATKHHRHQAPPAASKGHAVAPQKKPCIRRSSACTQPAPLHRMRDPAKTETATSHHPAAAAAPLTPRPSLKKCPGIAGELEPDAGLLVVAVTLAMLVLCGRACAIVCMSAWFYLLPRLRATAVADTAERKGSLETVDVDSQEQKRKVVLQGLLERNGRRPWGSFPAPAAAGSR